MSTRLGGIIGCKDKTSFMGYNRVPRWSYHWVNSIISGRNPSLFKENSERILLLTFSVLFANPKKLLDTVANPAHGLLNREKKVQYKIKSHSLAAPPSPLRLFGENHVTRLHA